MDKLQITGGRPLEGEVRISGAKNSALPLMCASLLSTDTLRLENVPHLMDITTMLRLLGCMGVEVSMHDGMSVELRAHGLGAPLAPYDMVKTMRASILVLGPLLEENLRRSMLLSDGDPSVFFTRPISCGFMVATGARVGKGVRGRRSAPTVGIAAVGASRDSGPGRAFRDRALGGRRASRSPERSRPPWECG